MKPTLNQRVIKSIIREEKATQKRYIALGKRYKIPSLKVAGRQEGNHAKLFKRISKRF